MSIEIEAELFNIIFPAVTGLFGVFLALIYEERKRKSEEKRWYMDHILERKIDSLVDLYGSLLDCFLSATVYMSYDPGKFDDYTRKENAYIHNLSKAAIYLDHDEYQVMYDFLCAFIGTKDLILTNYKVIDHTKLNENCSKAMNSLRKHLHPVIIKQISRKYNLPK